MAESRLSSKFVFLLHADVVGSTALVQQDEKVAHERIQAAFRKFSEIITAYGGVADEVRGDALVAEFEKASDAISAGLSFQADNAKRNVEISDEIRPELRIGVGMGEVIVADSTVTGAGVVLAQRLEQIAEAGEIVIQGAVQEAVPTRLPFQYTDLGEQEIKGFRGPVRAYSVSLIPGQSVPKPESGHDRIGTQPSLIPKRRWYSISTLVVLIIAVALLWLQPWQQSIDTLLTEESTIPSTDKPTVAVLPFDNLSDVAEQ